MKGKVPEHSSWLGMLSFPSIRLYIGFAENFIWKVCMDFDFVDMLTFFVVTYFSQQSSVNLDELN